MKGWVYFIACEPLDAVKIGYTEAPPIKRLAGLQTGCPARLKMLGYVRGCMAEEKLLHATFRPLHISGEWFRREGRCEDFLNWMIENIGQEVSRGRFSDAVADVISGSTWMPNAPLPEREYEATADSQPFEGWDG